MTYQSSLFNSGMGSASPNYSFPSLYSFDPSIEESKLDENQSTQIYYNYLESSSLNNQYFNPNDYQSNPNDVYSEEHCSYRSSPIFNVADLTTLRYCISNQMLGFNPWALDNGHPIYQHLVALIDKIIEKLNNLSDEQKIEVIQQAIAEICSLAANLGNKEILEIAVRHRLFIALAEKEKQNTTTYFENNNKLPENFSSQINWLTHILTRNGFFKESPVSRDLTLFLPEVPVDRLLQLYLDYKSSDLFRKIDYSSYEYRLNPYSPFFACEKVDHDNLVFDPTDLAFLNYCIDTQIEGFNPWALDQGHPIHKLLTPLVIKIFGKLKDLSDEQHEQKMLLINQAISEICARPVDLKHKELIEIATRQLLFILLSGKIKENATVFFDTNNQLPKDFSTQSEQLLNILTRDQYFITSLKPMKIIESWLLPNSFLKSVDQAIIKAPAIQTLDQAINDYENYIFETLKEYGLTRDDFFSYNLIYDFAETTFREVLALKLSGLITNEFTTKFSNADLKSEELRNAIEKINLFCKGNNNLQILCKTHIIFKTLNLNSSSQAPFSDAMTQVDQERKSAIEKGPQTGFWGALTSRKTKEERQAEHNDKVTTVFTKKMEVINFARALFVGSTLPFPSAPPLTSTSSTSEETPVSLTEEESTEQSQQPPPPVSYAMRDYPNPQPTTSPSTTSISIPTTTPSPTPVVTPPPPAPTPVTPIYFNVQQLNQSILPVKSYLDLALTDVVNRTGSEAIWQGLPQVNQKDALRHIYYQRMPGKAEQAAQQIFKYNSSLILEKLCELSYMEFKVPNGISEEVLIKGEEILHFYYNEYCKNPVPQELVRRFQEFPRDGRFYGLVYEQATAAGISIADWDKQWAEYNWSASHVILHSLQALERYLHS